MARHLKPVTLIILCDNKKHAGHKGTEVLYIGSMHYDPSTLLPISGHGGRDKRLG